MSKIRRASGPRRVRTSRTVSFLTGIFARSAAALAAPRERIFGALGPVGSRLVGSEYVAAPLTARRRPKTRPKQLCFLHRFFHVIFYRFLIDFASQLGTQNPTKSLKNRCQDAFHLGLLFSIDFWTTFVPNFDPSDFKKICFSIRKMKFS